MDPRYTHVGFNLVSVQVCYHTWTKSRGFSESLLYFLMTFVSMRACPLKRLKQPGLHRTHPITCSVDFWSQWPMAYSNIWYQTMNPEPVGKILKSSVRQLGEPQREKDILFIMT